MDLVALSYLVLKDNLELICSPLELGPEVWKEQEAQWKERE